MSADLGLFGPDTVTWRVHADPVMGLAGIRALLLQALHPLAMIGVAQHSDFRRDPWGRLLRTARYVGTVSYGTAEEARTAGDTVRAVHRFVRGIDPESGEPYAADDPELLLWVHCCLVDSFLTTYRRCGGAVDHAESDAYVAEQARLAPLVGLDESLAPTDEVELRTYFADVRPVLRATPEARRAAAFVVVPPMPLRVQLLTPARPAWAAVTGLAYAMLPRWARRMYALPGFPQLPLTDVAASAAGRLLRSALLAIPPDMREGPHYKDAKARLATDPPPLRRLDGYPNGRLHGATPGRAGGTPGSAPR